MPTGDYLMQVLAAGGLPPGNIAEDVQLSKLDPDMVETLRYLAEECRYTSLRVVPDDKGEPTIIGCHELTTTRALLVGIDRDSWEHRYCYQERNLATDACKAMQNADDAPLAGYVSSRHARPPKHKPQYRVVDHTLPDYHVKRPTPPERAGPIHDPWGLSKLD